MGQLSVYFFGNCPFLQHDRDGLAGLRQGRDENVDRAAVAGPRAWRCRSCSPRRSRGSCAPPRRARTPASRTARDRLRRDRSSSATSHVEKVLGGDVGLDHRDPAPSTVISGWASAFEHLGRIGARPVWNGAVTPPPPASRRRRPRTSSASRALGILGRHEFAPQRRRRARRLRHRPRGACARDEGRRARRACRAASRDARSRPRAAPRPAAGEAARRRRARGRPRRRARARRPPPGRS